MFPDSGNYKHLSDKLFDPFEYDKLVNEKICKMFKQKEIEEYKNQITGWQDHECNTTDNVNSPAHYNLNEHGIECIQAIEASMSAEEFIGYLRGNIMKYNWRFRYKNGEEDLRKSDYYKKLLNDRYAKYVNKNQCK